MYVLPFVSLYENKRCSPGTYLTPLVRVGPFSAQYRFQPTLYYINYMYVLHEYWIVYYFIILH